MGNGMFEETAITPDVPTRKECDFRHKPVDEFMKRIESKLNWFTMFVILTLGAAAGNLLLALAKVK